MDVASSRVLGGRGAPCLLRHCAALERVTGSERPSARARLETELGHELSQFLLAALVGDRGGRPAVALL